MAFKHNQTISCFIFISLYFLSAFFLSTYSLSIVSISETSNNQTLICALQPSEELQGRAHLNCTRFPSRVPIPLDPSTSFSEIVGGNGFVCALRPPTSSSKSIMRCWRSTDNFNFSSKRVHRGPVIQNLDAGNSKICGLGRDTKRLECWQWRNFNRNTALNFSSIAVGENFVCGLTQTKNITCLGNDTKVVGRQPNGSYIVIAAGRTHACAISVHGSLECWGNTGTVGEKPQGPFNSLALGENRSCALRANDRKVVCWGSKNFSMPERLQETRFVAIVAKQSVFCGVKSGDFSLYCWGNDIIDPDTKVFERVLPGSCRNENECQYGPLDNTAKLCGQNQVICSPPDPVLVPECPACGCSPRDGNNDRSSKMVAFLVVGCIGSASLLLLLAFSLYRYCNGKGCRVHDSGRLDESGNLENPEQAIQAHPVPEDVPEAESAPRVLEKRLSNIISLGNGGQLEEFPLQVLLEATNNFSEDHKIGTGSFGSVFHAILDDGREVAIKRAEISSLIPEGATRLQEDNDDAFVHELESLCRLNHKNLVRLLGYYEDRNERILVYEYMNNGSLNDHLHNLHSDPIMSWAGRIKVALDAARGIQYLHEYAIPPVIHRDIKPANILLDAKWTAKVSDFGLSLMGPEDEESHLSRHAAGTVGYIDPEYYRFQLLTTKSDVFSFGVVLLELLSGYKAIHKNEFGVPRHVVDFVVPYIVKQEIQRVLDPKMPAPTPYEIDAVVFVGYLAANCVSLEGRNRPNMSEIVNSLERALRACLANPPPPSTSTTGSSVSH